MMMMVLSFVFVSNKNVLVEEEEKKEKREERVVCFCKNVTGKKWST